LDGICCVLLGRDEEDPTCDPTTLPPPLLEIAVLTELDWLINWLWLIESEIDALVDWLRLSDVEADRLAESLGVIEVEVAAVPAEESLVEASALLVESLEDVEPLVLAESLDEVDPLVVVESLDDVEPDVDSEAESLVDCVAEALVGAALAGVSTALPSVAKVFRLAAVTSYETGVMGVMPDMVHIPFSPRAVVDRIGETTVDLQPLEPDLQRWPRTARTAPEAQSSLRRKTDGAVSLVEAVPAFAPCASGSCRPSA